MLLTALLAAGVFVAVPLTGWLLLTGLRMPVPTIARPSLWVAAGLAVWSIPLLGSLMMGVYRPDILGAAGWTATAVIVATRRAPVRRLRRLRPVDGIVLLGLLLAAMLAAAFPADPFVTRWDMGTYASHAVYMANHGRLDVPYPWSPAGQAPAGFIAPGFLFATEPAMSVRFANLFPAWLAQAYAASGYEGLVRVNVILGFFGLLAIYGFARRFVSAHVLAVLILFLAFNPAQVWLNRQLLSETMTQLFVWTGLLLLGVYLARGRPKLGVLAGALLGVSALVRIDAFLLVPFTLVGHALWNVLRSQPDGPRWKYVYLGAAPAFAAAVAYYWLFSQPYIVEHDRQLLQIAFLTVPAVATLGLSYWPPAADLARRLLARRAVSLGLVGALALAAAYAYFIRPLAPSIGQAENALPNLGRYLTPGVVWGGLAGGAVVFLSVIGRPRLRTIVPLLVVALGYMAVYVWDQAVSPAHFWAIRRFMPVIIPALVIFASLAAMLALAHLSRPGRRLAVGLAVPLLALFTLYIGLPTYTIAERRGAFEELAEFARAIPVDVEVLALGDQHDAERWWMPLYLAFDRRVTPIDITTRDGWAEAVARLRAATSDEPVLIVSARAAPAAPVGGRLVGETVIKHEVINEHVIPVPRTTRVDEFNLRVLEATRLDTTGVPFGTGPQWFALMSGMYDIQVVGAASERWTDGHGRIVLPVEGSRAPDRLVVSLAATGPDGAELRILTDGVALFDAAVPPGPWSAEFPLKGAGDLRLGGTAHIEIVSSTHSRELDGYGTVELGVQLASVVMEGPE